MRVRIQTTFPNQSPMQQTLELSAQMEFGEHDIGITFHNVPQEIFHETGQMIGCFTEERLNRLFNTQRSLR